MDYEKVPGGYVRVKAWLLIEEVERYYGARNMKVVLAGAPWRQKTGRSKIVFEYYVTIALI